MAYCYIYAPFSGTIKALNTYCTGGGTHPDVWLCCDPTDVGRTSGASMYFYGSTNISQITTTRRDNSVCATGSIPAPWDYGVEVGFYSSDILVARVFYGHIANPVANGTYTVRSKKVGDIAALPGDCPCGPSTDACCCYPHLHVHFERDTGGSRNSALACGTSVTAGSTWIFRWTAPV